MDGRKWWMGGKWEGSGVVDRQSGKGLGHTKRGRFRLRTERQRAEVARAMRSGGELLTANEVAARLKELVGARSP